MKDIELLQYVHETAEMGIQGIQSLEGQVHNGELQKALSQQAEEYRQIADSAKELLRSKGTEPKMPGIMAKVSSEVMSTVKTMVDPSASNIAEMVMQGNSMGVAKSTRHLNDYTGDDHQVRHLAEKLLRTEEANVEQMKPYL